ncbi:MAG TPA: hypothetical protein VFV42_03280 [Acidimicrobiales bacterium]|nr:hypothetical protein [Acidimicrobiales bacterium]
MTAGAAAGEPGSGRPRAVGYRRVAAALVRRPQLWAPTLRQGRALVPAGWWRRRPFLPVPDRAWLRFRMTTAYGDAGAPVDVEDLLTWLAWTDTVRPAPEPVRRSSARP